MWKNTIKFHLKEHQNNLSRAIKSLSKDKDSMVNMIGASFTLVLLRHISTEQYKHWCYHFKLRTKNWNAWLIWK